MRISSRAIKFSKKQRFFIWSNGPEFLGDRKILEKPKHKNYENILIYLEVRSQRYNGDTKVRDKDIAKFAKISIRTVQEGLAFLERHGFIMRIWNRKYKKGDVATVRFIRVWTAFFDNGCKPVDVWDNDFRPESNIPRLKTIAARYKQEKITLISKKEKFVDDENFTPEDSLMNRIFAQNVNTDFSTEANVDVVLDNMYNQAHSTLVPEDVLERYNTLCEYHKYHNVGEYSLAVKWLGYASDIQKKRRKKK